MDLSSLFEILSFDTMTIVSHLFVLLVLSCFDLFQELKRDSLLKFDMHINYVILIRFALSRFDK